MAKSIRPSIANLLILPLLLGLFGYSFWRNVWPSLNAAWNQAWADELYGELYLSQCEANLSELRVALQKSLESAKACPDNLYQLALSESLKLPDCPIAARMTYRLKFGELNQVTVFCSGHHHDPLIVRNMPEVSVTPGD